MIDSVSKKLQKELSKYAVMSPEDLEESSIENDVILMDFTEVTEESSADKLS